MEKGDLEKMLIEHIKSEDARWDKLFDNHLTHIQAAITDLGLTVVKINERQKLVLWVLGIVGSMMIVSFFKR